MAVGEPDVFRRREFCNFSKEDYFGVELNRFHGDYIDRKNGNCLLADSLDVGSRESGGFGRKRVNGCEISKLGEDGIKFPPPKKGKFSTVVCCGDERGSDGIGSKDRIAAGIASVSQSVSLNQRQGVEASLVEPVLVDGFEGSKLPAEDFVEYEEGEVVLEEGECFQMQDIAVSWWASDNYSPRNTSTVHRDNIFAREEEDSCANFLEISSTERVEFRRENSENRPRSSECEGIGSGLEHSKDETDNITQLELNTRDPGDFLWIEDPGSPDQVRINMLQGCRSVFEYEKVNKTSAGTYGLVYKAKDKKTGQHVALKKVKMENDTEGFPMTALREVTILFSLHHPSIVNLKEVVTDDSDNVYMAMEYMDYDLRGLLEAMNHPFSVSEVKYMMLQLLEGVCYLHENWVIHRDLKTSNVLLNERGKLKICDFGLSRQYTNPLKPYTSLVVTLWYRAPELLLGRKQYSTAIDMWSVGCIMAELLTKEPLFQGQSEIDQLYKIFSIVGTPTERTWPGFSKLQGARAKFIQQPFNMLRKKFPGISFTGPSALSDAGLDLLNKLLTCDPNKRISAKAALNHGLFHEFPPPNHDFNLTLHAQLSGRKSYL